MRQGPRHTAQCWEPDGGADEPSGANSWRDKRSLGWSAGGQRSYNARVSGPLALPAKEPCLRHGKAGLCPHRWLGSATPRGGAQAGSWPRCRRISPSPRWIAIPPLQKIDVTPPCTNEAGWFLVSLSEVNQAQATPGSAEQRNEPVQTQVVPDPPSPDDQVAQLCNDIRRAISPMLVQPKGREVLKQQRRSRQKRPPVSSPQKSVRLAKGGRGSKASKQQAVIIKNFAWQMRAAKSMTRPWRLMPICLTSRSWTAKSRPYSRYSGGNHPASRSKARRWQ